MGKNKVKCEECGYEEYSEYKHKVCPRCHGAMHSETISTIITKDIKETIKLMGEKK